MCCEWVANTSFSWLRQRLNFKIHPKYKFRHLKTLVRLSRSSGLYPECLVLDEINIQGNPIVSGAFGDIYKCYFGPNMVAVKVLKANTTSDRETILKAI
jgi:hypothetical protein